MEGIKFLADMLGVSLSQLISFSGVCMLALGYSRIDFDKYNSKNNGTSKLKDIKYLLDSDGLQLSKNISISAKNLFEHLMILGPTGSGKTSSIFLPNLLQKNSFCNSESSLVISDPKGELYKLSSSYQRTLGRKVKVFAPYDEHISIHYNPIDFCKNNDDIVALARDILTSGSKAIELRNGITSGNNKDVTWINMATPLFAAVLLYVSKLGYPYNTITNALKLILSSNDNELQKMLNNADDEDIKFYYSIYKKSLPSNATSASIQSSLGASVQSFLTGAIEKITSYTDFDFEDLRSEKIALYIIYPPEKVSDISPLTSIMFSQLFSSCMNNHSSSSLPVFCMFDEFANIGAIPDFATHVSLLRSYQISLICCLQDKTQLKNLYGSNENTIFNNLKNLALLGGSKDIETLKIVSTLCGKKDIANITKTSSNDKTTTSESTTSVEAFPINKLRNIEDDEILIMLKNKQPYLDKVNPYYKDRKYLKNVL